MQAQRGFTYLGVLLAIALLGIGLVAASEVWTMTAKRQRIEQLDWVGQQYVQAIGSYYEATPGVVVKTYPKTIDELLIDSRYATPRRHLRAIYVNPFTGQNDWILLKTTDGGIRGIRLELSVDGVVVRKDYLHELAFVPGTRARKP
jgi:type II secretory pathway pseudopilin PulG